MSRRLGIIGASGKLGSATLTALLSNNLISRDAIVACTSADEESSTWQSLAKHEITVRHATFDDGSTIERALVDCDRLFFVSSPRIELDFPDAGPGTGREADHTVAIQAALRAGIQHIYYTSLAFGGSSVAGVMRAHLRTESFLSSLKHVRVTVLRQGLYNESWPLYLGYYSPRDDRRGQVKLAGDGLISWTALPDLGLANALILAAPPEEWNGRTVYLSAPPGHARTIAQVAQMVGQHRGIDCWISIVETEEHVRTYVGRGQTEDAVRWWVSTYEAVRRGECLIEDSTLPSLLENYGHKLETIEQTIQDMTHKG